MKGRTKRFELGNLLASEKYKLIAVTETWTNETISDAMLVSEVCSAKTFPYSVFRTDRGNGCEGGGVCFFVHNCLSVSRVSLPKKYDSLEIIALDVYGLANETARVLRLSSTRRRGRYFYGSS